MYSEGKSCKVLYQNKLVLLILCFCEFLTTLCTGKLLPLVQLFSKYFTSLHFSVCAHPARVHFLPYPFSLGMRIYDAIHKHSSWPIRCFLLSLTKISQRLAVSPSSAFSWEGIYFIMPTHSITYYITIEKLSYPVWASHFNSQLEKHRNN